MKKHLKRFLQVGLPVLGALAAGLAAYKGGHRAGHKAGHKLGRLEGADFVQSMNNRYNAMSGIEPETSM